MFPGAMSLTFLTDDFTQFLSSINISQTLNVCVLNSHTKQMEMTYSHQTYFWNLKLQRIFSLFCQFASKLFMP